MVRNLIQALLRSVYLRKGTVRSGLVGPYRQIKFTITPMMQTRASIFYRSYESIVSDWLTQNVFPGMVIYFVGAHVGVHALFTAKLLNGEGQIIAFEGWDENYQSLVTNVRLNQQFGTTITPVHTCISDRVGQVTMQMGSSDGKHHIADETRASATSISVPSTTLDHYWSQNPACPDLLVIDIEGAEILALHGGATMIETCQPTMILEHHDQIDEITAWFKARNYQVTNLGRRHLIAHECT